MARRRSFQKGTIEECNGRFVIRFNVRDANFKSGWASRREMLPEGTTRKEAESLRSARLKSINSVNNNPDPVFGLTFEQFSNGLWLDYLDMKGNKPSTRYSYRSMLETHILPELGTLPLRSVSVAHLTRFFGRIRKERSLKYVVNLYALLSVMFEVAKEHDLVDEIPLRRKIHRPSHPGRARKHALTADQMVRVIEAVEPSYQSLFWTLALTGLRQGELLGLRWSDVDLIKRKMFVNRNLWRRETVSPKTASSIRAVPLSAALAEILSAHKTVTRFKIDDDFVFSRADGTPHDPDFLRRAVLYPALDKVGIRREPRASGFHLFRHSVATELFNLTGRMKVPQEYLGHSREAMTDQTYVHLQDSILGEAAELLSGRLTGTLGSDKVQ
jgi:integrase